MMFEIFDFYLDSKCNSYLIKSNRFFLFMYFFIYLCYRILLMFLKNERTEDSRLITAWNSFSTTLIVFTQNFIPLKRLSLVINVISLILSSPISKTRFIRRNFARNEQILQKKSIVLSCEANVCI